MTVLGTRRTVIWLDSRNKNKYRRTCVVFQSNYYAASLSCLNGNDIPFWALPQPGSLSTTLTSCSFELQVVNCFYQHLISISKISPAFFASILELPHSISKKSLSTGERGESSSSQVACQTNNSLVIHAQHSKRIPESNQHKMPHRHSQRFSPPTQFLLRAPEFHPFVHALVT